MMFLLRGSKEEWLPSIFFSFAVSLIDLTIAQAIAREELARPLMDYLALPE